MKWFRRIFLTLSTVLVLGGAAAGAWLPGPQHMLCPTCHGLQRIAPNTYVEASISEADRIKTLAALRSARAKVADFFGTLQGDPRLVVCGTRACARIFGSSGAKGVAYGWHAVLLARSRIFEVIAAHELAHIELHWRMGLLGWMRGTVPAWFDEGLAVVISDDPRFGRDADAQAVREVMTVSSFLGDWSEHARRVGWRTAYGAASTRVRQLQRVIGREGLKQFVARLAREGDLSGMLAQASSRQRVD